MKLPRFSVRRPIFTTMVTLILVILGSVSLSRLQIDMLPDIELPTLTIRTDYEGASPEVIERLVTRIIEEIVAVVETDACGCDAIQVITGCTFGKGNFIYRDYGKHAFTFFNRDTGQGVRVSRKAQPQEPLDPEHRRLLDKIRQDTATPEERAEFDRRHEAASRRILDQPPEALFTLTEVTVPLPEKARIEPSVTCARCGEPTMATKMETMNGERVCRGCLS